jgi:acetolactate synthase I/II/III large subunit
VDKKEPLGMSMTVGGCIARTLKEYGVTCVFGMEDPVHLTHGLDGNAVRTVTVRDEKHGAIMAHGYAKATNRPGICLATCGPGATNLITGLLEAQKSSIPVIAFVQEIPMRNRGRHAASEVDHEACLAPYVKWVGRIELAERALEITHHAFRIATSGRPGPVVVLCPPDIMAQEIAAEIYAESDYAAFPATRSRPDRARIKRAAELLLGARRPAILAGGGVIISQAWEEVVELAERLKAPVATTMNGKGVIADDHPLSAGVSGTSTGGRYGRGKVANEVLAEADVVLIIGSRNGQICSFNWTLPRPGTTVIHVDMDPVEIGRNFRTAVPLVGDARETLRDLLTEISGRSGQAVDPESRLRPRHEEWRRSTADVFSSNQVPVRPERLLREISTRVADGTIVVADASYVTGWATSHIDSTGGGNAMISPRGTGGIGWSLPAAIGAKMAQPDRRVICITGDGAFGYILNELETAARYHVPLVVVVFNNATLAFQKHYELKLFGSHRECDLLDIDFAAVARGLRCEGERVTEPAEIGPALDRAFASGRPYVVDVVIDPEAMAPIVGLDREQVLESH